MSVVISLLRTLSEVLTAAVAMAAFSVMLFSLQFLRKRQKLAIALAVIDANFALSEVSSNNGYIRPSFNDNRVLDVKEGRHPILEKVGTTQYVPNDIHMDDRYPIQIITGPNMGGKSTYMRQCALQLL